MTQLSPHYRNDSSKGLSEELKAYLDKNFWQKLPYLDVPHPRLVVVFSGGNGVGKSTLSARIQTDLQAIVLENDNIKMSLLERYPELDRDQLNVLTWQYSMDLYGRLTQLTPNGLVVRDGVIDWYYDRILPVFKAQGYALFVIAYELSRQKRIELIKQRGDKPTIKVDRFVKLLTDHDIHIARFRNAYTPDIILTENNLFEYDHIITKLRERLRELNQ